MTGEVTYIRTLAESRTHWGTRPSGRLRREGTRLEPGELQEIQAAAERGQEIKADQALGLVEVVQALGRRAYVRFQETADAREALMVEQGKVEDLQAQLTMLAAEHRMYVDRVGELDKRLADRVVGTEDDLAAACQRIAELEAQLARMSQADTEAADTQLTAARQWGAELERQLRAANDHTAQVARERDDAVREMGRARTDYATARGIADENGEALAAETVVREKLADQIRKVRELVSSEATDIALKTPTDSLHANHLADVTTLISKIVKA